MFGIPDAAIGAVVAAIIAGAFSLLGLVISKEQKVSEFRQAWVDALRQDLATYFAELTAAQEWMQVDLANDLERVKVCLPHYVRLNTAYHSIVMRLNLSEDLPRQLNDVMLKLSEAVSDRKTFRQSTVEPLHSSAVDLAGKVLKAEWKRVKAGEPGFRLAKLAAGGLLVVGLLAAAALVLKVFTGPLERAAAASTREAPAQPLREREVSDNPPARSARP